MGVIAAFRASGSFCAAFVVAGCVASPPPLPNSTPSSTAEGSSALGSCREPSLPTNAADAADLPLHSVGLAQDRAWILDENGYVGAFVRVETTGSVSIKVSASGHADQGAWPHMNIVLAGVATGFDVGPDVHEFPHSVVLPAGTYFLRVEQTGAPPGAHRELRLEGVSIEGGKLLDDATDELALAAADSYIAFGRRGRATLKVPGATAGQRARVKLVRHAFNFGVNMPFSDNRLIPEEVIPGSIAERYQKLVLARFNTIVLSNAGKWVYQEGRRDRVTLADIDRLFAFADKHGLRARMHTMLWDTTQQPEWVGSLDPQRPGLMTRAKSGDDRARVDLDRQIEERIGYYVKDRAKHYLELDVINESVHKPRYLQIYGAAGLAEIFNKTASAVREGGATTRLFLNEYNVLQWSEDPLSGAPDPYANWYRRHADSVIAAGGQVDGLGVQYYPDGRNAQQIGSNAHSPARAFAALQNLATTGRRLSLTELTVNAPNATPARAAELVEDTARLVFGTPEADTFMIWAMWEGAAGDPPFPASVLADLDFKPTLVGRRFDALMKSWKTDLEVPVGADGTVEFDGFYGDYLITIGNRTERFAFTREMSRNQPGAAPSSAQPSARSPIEAAVSASDRSSEDRALDAGRKPKELLDFCRVGPGMRVAELGAGGGYTAELLSRVVGPTGKVYGQNSKFLLERFAEKPWSERLKKPLLSNVIRVDRDFDDPLPPEAKNLDVVMLVLFYHDTVWQKVDRARMNRNVRDALKPGGTFCVVDHSARAGSGAADAETLHRIDEAFVKNEIGQAGFKLAAEGSFLENPGDQRDWNASPRKAAERRGTSDRFVLRFEK